MKHDLKVWPQYFIRIFTGQKEFEVRKNDRNFEIGDLLHLKEYDPETKTYTGREIFKKVSYVLRGPGFGIEDGFCVMSLID